jgi:hypothetical protein
MVFVYFRRRYCLRMRCTSGLRVPKNGELVLIPSPRFFEERISENKNLKLPPLSGFMFDSIYATLKERANHDLMVTTL